MKDHHEKEASQRTFHELRTRVLTGVIGAALLSCVIGLLGLYGLFLVVWVVSSGMLSEFCEMVYAPKSRTFHRRMFQAFVPVLLFLELLYPDFHSALWASAFLLLSTITVARAKRSDEPIRELVTEWFASGFALIYLIALPSFLIRIYTQPSGLSWIIFTVLLVWAGDIGAYFMGIGFGKRTLHPRVSPKKTIEGSLGGLLSSLLFTFVFFFAFQESIRLHLLEYQTKPFTNWELYALLAGGSIVLGLISQIGDLAESLLKRAFHVKDTSDILPGHGGFLDRFDGLIFVLPVMHGFLVWMYRN